MFPIRVTEGTKQDMFDFITGWYWFDRVERVEVYWKSLDEDIGLLTSWWMARKETLWSEETFSLSSLLGMEKAYDFFWNAMAVTQVMRCFPFDRWSASDEVANGEEEVICSTVSNTAKV